MGEPTYVSTVKLVLLGESSVGKSTIVTRFTTGEFHKNNATIGAAFTTKELEWEGSEDRIKRRVKFEIWDTAGQERYRSLAPMYYRNTDVALVVFDVTQPASKNKAQSWIDELNNYLEDYKKDSVQVRVVGNKTDLIDKETITNWKDAILVSAKTGEGVNDLFLRIAESLPLDKFKLLQENMPLDASLSTARSNVDLTGNSRTSNHQPSCGC
ncbi:unnamed protein product [Kluyveromyces dobzhanskii CBS 2104]|uniref:WGS project CCBQ000000000 data, contig 00272 n=1 Tax=Kluyveromyces dobzhanskii CBS 2104 TaxID=1427455 RepID=A0A0A8L8B8_9SACH|nr:unnamed protein product [Kluyveromyces dobzhanskii CBS 2104]